MKKLLLSVYILMLTVQAAFAVDFVRTVGTTGANYATLKLAFDAINNGTLTGTISLEIIDNTSEVASAVLNASGGSANYTLVNIYPTETGKTISGSLATPLIDLSGADNVIIDGRLNATGSTKDLTISNSNAASNAGTSTIRFINDASGNTIKYCTVKGSTTDLNSGVFFFSTGTTTGNDNNTIDNCAITNAGTRVSSAIYASGSSTEIQNGSNTISNNSIYDISNDNISYQCLIINITSGNTAWTILRNSFYSTSDAASANGKTYYFIFLDAADGNGFTISENYIGGNAPLCAGTYTSTTYSNAFLGIYTTVGTSTATEIQGNIIKNINWHTGTYGGAAITTLAGLYNVGTTTGNTIGCSTGTGSITITGANYFNSGSYSGFFYGIRSLSSTTTIKNNTIGSITTVANPADKGIDIIGIYSNGNDPVTIQNNTIGSTDAGTTSSIYASGPGAATYQYVYGIYSICSGTVEISGNTISKLTNGATGSNQTFVHGIRVTNGTNTISNNTIRDLKIINQNPSTNVEATAVGISLYFQSGPNASQTVSGNTIYNLENSDNLFSGEISGIVFRYDNDVAAVHTISKNFIHSLKISGGSASGNLVGIYLFSGRTTTSNNVITLGGTSLVNLYGIYDIAKTNLYSNTVYIGGTAGSGTKISAALYNTDNSTPRVYKNNIFTNARSTTGGSNLHYAMYITTSGVSGGLGALDCNYNDYYVSGTGGTLGYYGGNVTSLPIVTGVTGNDAASLAITPSFLNAGGTIAADYRPAAALNGVDGTGITIDYRGYSRATTPSMGAFENKERLYVHNHAGGTQDGYSWTNAITNLDVALASTTSATVEIWVEEGFYQPGSDHGLSDNTNAKLRHFRMKPGVKIYGGFAGTETATNQRTLYGAGQANETILSGDNGDWVDNTDNIYHVFYHPSELGLTSSAVLDGFTIKLGYANGSTPHDVGGGMANFNNSPTITNCIFSDNYASSGGGAYYSGSASNSVFTNCWFNANTSGSQGGAMKLSGSSNVLTNTTIQNCTSTSIGGGIVMDAGTALTLTNCTISNNSASGGGGLNILNSVAVTMTNCTVANNTASSGSTGGGIHLNSQTGSDPTVAFTIKNNIFANNGAYDVYGNGGVRIAVADNGNNIIEASNLTFNATGDITGNQVNLNLAATPTANNSPYSARTLKLTSGSIAINAGSGTGTNGGVSVPAVDQRGAERNGITDIGAYEYWNDEGVLPVELTSFTASVERIDVVLNWSTANEVNNYGFEIEKTVISSQSSEIKWSKIGFVEGNGTTNAPKSYSFTDKSASGKISYRLKQIDRDGKFEYSQIVEVTALGSPKEFALDQNYPNPFNPMTAIGFQLSANGFTTLKIYDAIGKEVATLVNEVKKAGTYSAKFDGTKFSSGIYFARLSSNGKSQMRKLILMK